MPPKSRSIPRLHDIEAVVFDLDGVLVDSEPLHLRAANRVLAHYGVSISESESITFVGLGEHATWAAWRKRFGMAASIDELLAAHTETRLQEIAAGVPVIAEATELARRLHREAMPLAIASSSAPAIIDALLTAIHLADTFVVRVSGENVAHSKPAPDVYVAAAAQLGVTPAVCLAIEDSAPGVAAAKGAGMTCIAVPNRWTEHQDFSAADVVLASLSYFPLLVL